MAMMKKAKTGVSLRSGQLKRIGRLEAKNPDRATNVAKRMVERDTRKERGQDFITKNLDKLMPKRAKSGGSFPDLNKDGKITKADILKGRGVIAKKGASVRKAGFGDILGKVAKVGGFGLAGMAANKLFGGKKKEAAPGMAPAAPMAAAPAAPMAAAPAAPAAPAVAPMKKGGKVAAKKKMQYGGKAASMKPTMKSGGKMGKCKYGCN
jgi:hypothetical protein